MSKRVILIGAGGHAKVIADIILKSDDSILGFLDDDPNAKLWNINNLGKINSCLKYAKNNDFIIAIGKNEIRSQIAKKYFNLQWYTAIHPSSQIAQGVIIGEGTTIMANAVINSDAEIGKHVIVNTGAIIEHDNIIGEYVHLSPRVVLGGTVCIENNTHIGIGAVVKNNITICSNVIVGSGAVVVKNIKTPGIYTGIPAKIK